MTTSVIRAPNFPALRGSVATLGNFDGVHLGHQQLLALVQSEAMRRGLPSIALSFYPHPRVILEASSVHLALQRLPQKLESLSRYDIDYLACIRFNHALSQISASEFLERYLLNALGVRLLVIGADAAIGQGREARAADIEHLLSERGVEVLIVDDYTVKGDRVGSRAVRQAVAAGDCERATALLGRPYAVCGRVSHGHKRGRQLGIPTLNLRPFRQLVPRSGVYCSKTRVGNGEHFSVTNVGVNPTFQGRELRVETHLLGGFCRDIYGERIEVFFHHYLRPEQRFRSREALTEQIRLDIEDADKFFQL